MQVARIERSGGYTGVLGRGQLSSDDGFAVFWWTEENIITLSLLRK
jgi:hypothetical protein